MIFRFHLTYTFIFRLFLSLLVFLVSLENAWSQCFPAASGVTVNYTITPPACNGDATGSVTIVINGGGAPYTFTIAGSAISFQSVSQASNTYTFTNLPADPNFFISTQAKIASGFAVCNFSNLSMSEPAAITAPGSITDASCNGAADGAIDITPAGGTAPYAFAWSTSATSEDISGLTAGNYSLTITDANGCNQVFNYTVNEPALITAPATITDASCNGAADGAIDITPAGGTAPYVFLWNTGATSEDISGLTAGNYSVTITDANGCPPQVFNYTINEPAVLTAPAAITDASCNGAADGAIDITPAGGTAPYAFLWNTGATSEDLTGLTAGNYSLTVTDANGCNQLFNFTVNEPALISAPAAITDASCNGVVDGAIDITPAGGTAPYAFLWNTGATSEDLTGLTAGNYSLTVTDANGCNQLFNFTVNEPAGITAPAAITDASCNGAADGAIDITPAGGTAPYAFLWNTSATSEDLTGLTAGNYSVTVTDANGCNQLFNFTVNEPAGITAPAAITDASCNGAADGAIDITPAGGTAPYAFLWNTGATSEDLTGLTAGNYSLTVTDANGCNQVFNYTVNEPALITAPATITDASCNGAADGAIDITPAGGTAPYAFLWNTAATSEDISGLTAGNYSVTITDANGCNQLFNFTVNEPAGITITSSITDASCNGAADGAIDITPVGGTAPYAFLWNTGATSEDITGLTAGNYSVTITDANGCNQLFNFTVNEPAGITAPAVITDASCNGAADGAIDITPAGGTAPYAFLWNTGATSEDISGLTAGNYSVTITDASGCPGQLFNYTVNEPAGITAPAAITDASCNGAADGAIDITPAGGTAPYAFLWNTGATSEDITGLTAGNYSVTITDASGCPPQVFNYTVNEPAGITAPAAITDASCNGAADGAIDITPAGGTAPYAFLWNTGATSEDITGLTAGNYSVTVTDANGCNQLFNFTVNEPAGITAPAAITDASCNGAADGAIDITPAGGTAPYAFLWNTGATSEDLTGLTAGNYSLTVTDANGCNQLFNFTVNEPAGITAPAVITDASCNGAADGAIDITPAGGTAPYAFLWNTGATSEDISGLTAGNYSVTVTDASGCPGQLFNYTVNEPAGITAPAAITDASCNGAADGAIDITPAGGTAPYAFLWNTGATSEDITGLTAGNYSVTVTDANGCNQLFNFTVNEPAGITITSSVTDVTCNSGSDGSITLHSVSGGTAPYAFLWNTGASTQNVVSLSAGNYTVTITDANGCNQLFNFTVNEPTPVSITSTVADVSCNGGNDGSITLNTVSGATPGYTFLWSNGATTQNIAALTAGNYSVTVSDAIGCPQIFNFTVGSPAPITITSSSNDVSTCGGNDGSIDITLVSGGTAPYSFLWNTGAITQNISGLVSGVYSVVITDGNGCSQAFNFSISDPTPFTVNATVNDVTCNGSNDGSITHTITGGTAPFVFAWNTGATTQDISSLGAGNYTVTITDASNCAYNGNYTIAEPAAISIVSSSTDVTTCGGNDGSISISSVNGGTAGYTFLWNTGATTQNLSGLTAGNYSVTVTDNNGCTEVFNFSISDPASFTVTATVTDVSCPGAADGTIVQNISGGNAPFTIVWNTGAATPTISGLSGGTYSVSITDANNCSFNANYTVNEPSPIAVVSAITDVTSCGGNDGAIDLNNVTGGTGPYTFLWSTGAVTQNISGLAAGSYSVTVTDASGCTMPFNFTVSDPVPFTVAETITDVTCNGSANGSISLTLTGGNAPFSFTWSNGATASTLTNVAAGNYTVSITDASSCTFNGNYTVNEPAPVAITSAVTDATCNGSASGNIDLTSVSGGTAPYAFNWSNGATSQNLSNVAAGNYSVAITDASGCVQNFNFTVNEPTAITATGTSSSPSTCGGNDGGITLSSVNGGTGPYTFLWNTGATTQNISGLTAGTYSVTITDATGCPAVFNYSVSDPAPFAVTPSLTAVTCNGGNNGAIGLTITGGTAPFTILWNTGASTNAISSLTAGNYSVSITDASGCTFNGNYVITEPAAIGVTSAVSNTSNCSATDGSITLTTVTGGTPGYSFNWSNGATTQNITGLSNGNYSVTITDAASCSNVFSFAVSNPTPFTVNANVTNLSCGSSNTGAIDLTITGSINPPLTILWNTGDNTTSISGLTAGNYSVVVNDASGCAYNGSYTITQPGSVDTSAIIDIKTPVLCAGSNEGSIQLTNINGGVAPYTFILNGVNSSVPSFDTLTGGSYTMTIIDAAGCTFYHSFTIFEPAPLSFSINTTPAVCTNNNGTLAFTAVTGGTAPYLYSIDSGSTFTTQTSYTGLAPASYNVFVKDSNQCTYGYTVPVILKQGPVPYIRVVPPTCNGGDNGAIIIDSLAGGVSPFTFYFNGQNRGSSKVFTDLIAGNYKLSIEDQECRYDIEAYLLYDNSTFPYHYDTLNFTPVITVPQPAPVTASVLTENTYNKESSGVAVLYDFQGGTAPYGYSLDTTAGYTPLSDTLVYLAGLDKGYYKVFLKDTNDCKGELTVHIRVGFFIPNLITPNGDGQNDYFEIMALPLNSTLSIYNSWNSRIYYDNNYNNSWEAKGLSDGVYYYELVLPNGNQYKGWLQVLR